jgi:hypothetical protein
MPAATRGVGTRGVGHSSSSSRSKGRAMSVSLEREPSARANLEEDGSTPHKGAGEMQIFLELRHELKELRGMCC